MLEALTKFKTLAGECVDTSVWSLSDDALVRSLDEVQRAEQALAAVKLRLIRQVHGRELPIAQHASGAAAWLRDRYRISARAAERLTELARFIDEHPGSAAALAAGEINVEQAQVIATTVTDLPADVGIAVKGRAEAELITQASDWEPTALRQLGWRILDYVAPERHNPPVIDASPKSL